MNESTGSVVERDVDVDAAERSLRESGAKVPELEAKPKGEHHPMSRWEFVKASNEYKPKVEIVDLPEPFEGRQIKVRELTAGERDHYEGRMVRGRLGNQRLNMEELRIGLVVAAAVEWEDETTPLFNEKDKDSLRNMGISVIQAIYNVASKLSAVSAEDEEELLGNSKTRPSPKPSRR